MTIQTVELSTLKAPSGNPRKAINGTTIAGLAASIRADGLLQNLVVKPMKGKGKRYRIISGERRFRALQLLQKRGDLANSYEVPVEIRAGLSKDDSMRIATVENVQRENLAPLDEAKAFAALITGGTKLDDLCAQTGLSESTLKRRLALNGLCKKAMDALEGGTLSLSQAEALSLGDQDTQETIAGHIVDDGYGYDYTADEIRRHITGEKPNVALAIFPPEQYTGTLTHDLFAEDETTFFDDVEQFLKLQRRAVEALIEQHREKSAWVELTEHGSIRDWIYEQANEGAPSGVLINMSPSGKVEIREGLAAPEIDEDTAAALDGAATEAKKTRPAYAKALRQHIAHHKSMAVQQKLIENPRKAKEVAAVCILDRLSPHDCLTGLAKVAFPQDAYKAVDDQARHCAVTLGLEDDAGQPGWAALIQYGISDTVLYELIKALSDDDLDTFLNLVTVISFGQKDCEEFDTRESLFNLVARDLEINMRDHWIPDFDFLNRRSKDQLVEIAKDCGYPQSAISLGRYKKSELVASLLRHFQHGKDAAAPSPHQQTANAWLPEAMQFPALDPDKPEENPPMEETA